MWEIYLDSDNITVEQYYTYVKKQIKDVIEPQCVELTPVNTYSQSNITIKYECNREMFLKIFCSKHKAKNSTDANILFNVGKSVALGNKVVIVSNDLIFREIECDDVVVVRYMPSETIKKHKLKKANIIKALEEIKDGDKSRDVTLSDLKEYFICSTIPEIKKYIESLKDIDVSSSDVVYIKN